MVKFNAGVNLLRFNCLLMVFYPQKGYNSTIFAYGQTGAGKTFTMLGKSDEQRGLQPRVFEHIFKELLKFESARVKCTYLEIYNEQIIDLVRDFWRFLGRK